METDPEQFDCTVCPLAAAQAALWPENVEAWSLFERVSRRFVHEFKLGPDVMQHSLAGRDSDDVLDMVDRLTIIYDVLAPPTQDP